MHDTRASQTLTPPPALTGAPALAIAPAGGSPAPALPLAGAPVTIGSGPRCVLRVTEPGVAPIECVISPTAQGPQVRYWAGECRLNGATFEEAPLREGDRLKVGLRLYEIVAAETPSSRAPSEANAPGGETTPTPAATSQAAATAAQARLASDRRRVARLADALRRERRDARLTSEQLATSEAAVADLLARLEHSLASAAAQSAEADEALVGRLCEAEEKLAVAADTIVSAHERVAELERLLEESRTNPQPNAVIAALGADDSSEPEPQDDRWFGRPLASDAPQPSAPWPSPIADEPQLDSEADSLDSSDASDEAAVSALDAVTVAAEVERDGQPQDQTVARTAEDDEPAWGIESLTPSSSPSEAAALWGLTSEKSADEPETPSADKSVDTLPESATVAADPSQQEASDDESIEAAPGSTVELADEPAALSDIPTDAGAPFAAADESVATPLVPCADQLGTDTAAPIASEPGEVVATDAFTTPEEPASFIERYKHLIPDEESPEAPEPIAPPAPPEPVAFGGFPANEAAAADDGDESIDEYMRKMMERIRGGAPEPAPEPVDPRPQPAVQPTAPTALVAPVQESLAGTTALESPAPDASGSQPMQSLSEIKRSENRVVQADMGALRQLANQSARHAIDVANVRQTREQALVRYGLAVFVFGCGVMLTITSTIATGAQFILGTGLLAGGGWFFMHTLRRNTAAIELRKRTTAAPAGDE